jgi:hypothetical protein
MKLSFGIASGLILLLVAASASEAAEPYCKSRCVAMSLQSSISKKHGAKVVLEWWEAWVGRQYPPIHPGVPWNRWELAKKCSLGLGEKEQPYCVKTTFLLTGKTAWECSVSARPCWR